MTGGTLTGTTLAAGASGTELCISTLALALVPGAGSTGCDGALLALSLTCTLADGASAADETLFSPCDTLGDTVTTLRSTDGASGATFTGVVSGELVILTVVLRESLALISLSDSTKLKPEKSLISLALFLVG
jgi:hypothetical protein